MVGALAVSYLCSKAFFHTHFLFLLTSAHLLTYVYTIHFPWCMFSCSMLCGSVLKPLCVLHVTLIQHLQLVNSIK